MKVADAELAENSADLQQVTGQAAAGTVGSRSSATEQRRRDLCIPAGHSVQRTKLPGGKIGKETNVLPRAQPVMSTNPATIPIDTSAEPSHAGSSHPTGH